MSLGCVRQSSLEPKCQQQTERVGARGGGLEVPTADAEEDFHKTRSELPRQHFMEQGWFPGPNLSFPSGVDEGLLCEVSFQLWRCALWCSSWGQGIPSLLPVGVGLGARFHENSGGQPQ